MTSHDNALGRRGWGECGGGIGRNYEYNPTFKRQRNLIFHLSQVEMPPKFRGLGMFRLVLLLLVGMSIFDSAHAGWLDDLRAKRDADIAAMIKAGKIPPVQLSPKQMASLKKETQFRDSQITWLGSGRQKDGKIFVCHVATGKNAFGNKTVSLHAGWFDDANAPYHQSIVATEPDIVLQICRQHGFAPPVTVRRTYF